MRFGELDFNPAKSPAILDTATWAPAEAARAVSLVAEADWHMLRQAVGSCSAWRLGQSLTAFPASYVRRPGADYCLAQLLDGQQVFLEIRDGPGEALLGVPLTVKTLLSGAQVAVYPTQAGVIDRFCRLLKPARGPQALGAVARLGIGTRMTTLVWPAIWRALTHGGFAANAIQNSVRELNLLEPLLAGQPPEKNVAFNFGTIETGYTGSTFEGLWVAGVLQALQADVFPAAGYGADADHLQVKRGANGLARARRLVEASRYYSFYTLDVSDVLDYAALLTASAAEAEAAFERWLPSTAERRALVADYAQPWRVAGREYRLDATLVARLMAKHGRALDAVEQLVAPLTALKAGVPFDLEISIDEHPGEVATFDCLTTEAELIFLLREARRRGLPLTHIAPNYGVEKGVDYACPDGLPGLEQRAARLNQIAADFGVMADFHSGDDLAPATRQVLRRATQGRLHFKVSPRLQLLFAEVLEQHHPALFQRWWDDALAYARREAAAGSAFAADCARAAADTRPSAHAAVFHHFSFAFVGRRDAAGQFLHREEFYDLSAAFQAAYTDRIERYLLELANDLF